METALVQQNSIPALSVGPFVATRIGLIVQDGDVPFEVWEVYGVALERVQGSIQWVCGDWLNFGERKYGEMYAQGIQEEWERDYDTLADYARVAGRIEFRLRNRNLSWWHHREVAPLEPEEQSRFLALAESEGWSVRELRKAIRDWKRGQEETPPLPEGRFAVIYADPPWEYDNTGFAQSAASHYRTMSVEDICGLSGDVGRLCTPATVLFLWATSPLLDEAFTVIEAWGFDYKASMVWDKGRAPGLGWFLATEHEHLLIATREENTHPATKPSSVVRAEPGRHSEKPDIFYELIESMYKGPYCELFARTPREGWVGWGDEYRQGPL